MNPYILRTVVHLDQPGRDISWAALACVGNANAHRIEVEVRERGAMVDLSGAEVVLYAYRSDSETVLVEGEVGSDGRAGATLSEPCYAHEGKLACTLTILNGGVVLAAARVFLVVKAAYGGAIIDPGETLPTLDDLLAQTAAIEQAIKDAKTAAAAANSAAEKANAVAVDPTLSVSGRAADAAITGERLSRLTEEIGEAQEALSSEDIIVDDKIVKDNVTVTRRDNVYDIDIQTITLFNATLAKHPVMLQNDAYYMDGFKIIDVVNSAWSNNIGFVFAKNSESYYAMAMNHNVLGPVYSVSYSTGVYTKVIESVWHGARADTFEIISASLDSLSVKITSNTGEDWGTYEIDLAGINAEEICVGFMPYAAPVRVKFARNRVKYAEIPDVSVFATKGELKIYNPRIALASNALSGNEVKIKILGDSITAGLGGAGYDVSESGGGDLLFWDRYQNVNGHCWANSLKDYVEEKFPNVTVRNYGVAGATSRNLVQYFSTNNLVTNDDDVVIVMIGTNDREAEDARQYLYNNLLELHQNICAMGKTMIVMSSIPTSVLNEEEKTGMHMEDVDMVINAFAIDHGLPYISTYKLFTDYCRTKGVDVDSLLGDGLHPTDDGYDVMFYLISNALGFTTKRDGASW